MHLSVWRFGAAAGGGVRGGVRLPEGGKSLKSRATIPVGTYFRIKTGTQAGTWSGLAGGSTSPKARLMSAKLDFQAPMGF